jgi:hypothetical protein
MIIFVHFYFPFSVHCYIIIYSVLHGLMRVRAFNQDDDHIFMLPDQIKSEIK